MKIIKKEDSLKSLYTKEYVNKLLTKSDFRIKYLLKSINFLKNELIVDYGCGDGKLSFLIHNKVKEYYGVDFSEEFIKIAKNKYEIKLNNVKFYCGNIIDFIKKNQNKFDKAFTLDFSEHIYDNDFIKIYTSIKQSLKNNGKLYIHTPNGKYFLERLKKTGIMKQIPVHIAVRNDEEYIKLLKKIGFNKIKIIYIPHYVTILKLFHFLSFIPFIGKYFKARLFIICEK